MAVFTHSFSIFFPPNMMKTSAFWPKNWAGGFHPGIFVEIENNFDLVYYRPINDFWIKSYGRIQSQFFHFFSSKYDENK